MNEPVIPCSEAVRQLWRYLDDALSPEDQAKVDGHLAFCRQCCGELEFARELQAFLASHEVEEIPAHVRGRLERFVREL
jgi:anti-sigma factor RsiW